jgi:hypothetical protein
MEDRLESETRLGEAGASAVGGLSGLPQASVASELEDIGREIDVDTKLLISRCLDGSEPYGCELRPWEQQKFNPRNIQTVLLKAAGFKHHEIASILEINKHTVDITCTHPYGRKIISAMLRQQGGRVIDIKTRLEIHAGNMLEKMMEIAEAETDLKTVAAVTFGLLDRSGHGPQQKIEASNAKRPAITDQSTISRLANALDESQRVSVSVMPHFNQKAPPMDSPNAPGRVNRDSFEAVESEGAHRTGTDP